MTIDPLAIPAASPLSGVIPALTAPNLARHITEALAAAQIENEPLLTWTADPVTREVKIAPAREVR